MNKIARTMTWCSCERLLLLATALLLVLGVNSIALAQSFDKMTPQRFLWQGTFGLKLSPPTIGLTHRIVAYLPHGTLVFYHPTLGTKQIGSKEYRAVVTQFGQQLWVLNSEVSNSTSFRKVYGTQNIIFNQDGFMCPEENKFCDEVSGQEINRGSVLETVTTGTDFYHLRLREGFGEGEDRVNRTRDGFLSVRRFNGFERLGVLTDARKQHPAALHLGATRLESLSTRCGEQWSGLSREELSGGLEGRVGFDLLTFLSASFGIKATKTESEEIRASYGGAGLATERIQIMIKRPNEDGKFRAQPVQRLYMSLEIKCIGSQNDQEAVHIQSVTVRDERRYLSRITSRDVYELDDGFHTPSDDALSLVYSKNGGRPFLLSISSRDDYRRAMAMLMAKINNIDVSLANILLSELNSSCSNRLEGERTDRRACSEALPRLR